MVVNISPVFNVPYLQDANGLPLAGGKIFAYEAGSNSVLKDTYTTETGDVLNANPIVLDSSGNLPAAIWLTAGEAYNLVLTAADGTTVLKGFDNVVGVIGPTSASAGASPIWVNVPGVTFLSSTQFLVPGNFASEFAAGNRVRLTQSSGFIYGVVSAVSFSSPNTIVTVINDAATINSSVSSVDYSVLLAAGRTVDAGAVSYFDALPYVTTNTVGWKIQQIVTSLSGSNAETEAKRARGTLVYTTTGSGSNTPYSISPSPAIASYSTDAIWVVKFADTGAGTPTLNINGVGAAAIKQYSSSGVLVTATPIAGQVSQVAYDAANSCFVLLDPLPAAVTTSPHGIQAFTTNGTFTTPASVYSIRVTCVGGGGAGGDSYVTSLDGMIVQNYPGGTGGQGAQSVTYLSTTPGTTYAVAIGAGGIAASGSGGTTTFGITAAYAGPGGGGGAAGPGGPGGAGSPGTSGTGVVFPGVIQNYGKGGTASVNGNPGVVSVEW